MKYLAHAVKQGLNGISDNMRNITNISSFYVLKLEEVQVVDDRCMDTGVTILSVIFTRSLI